MKRKTRNLNIFYLSGNNIAFKKYLEEQITITHDLQIEKDSLKKNENLTIDRGKILIIEESQKEPDWMEVINQLKKGQNKIKLDKRHTWTALIFMKFKEIKGTLLLSFGRTSGILKEEYVIHDFGIETAKQIVNSQNLSQINIQSFDDRQTRIQKFSIKLLNKNHLIEPFKLNSIYNFLGNTRIDDLSVSIGGTNSLKVKGSFNIKNDLLNLIDSVLSTYRNRDLEEPLFDVAENINPITDPKMQKKLNKLLHSKLVTIFGSSVRIDGNSIRNLHLNPNKDIAYDDFLGYIFTSIGFPIEKTFSENELDLDILYIYERIQRSMLEKDLDSILRKLKNIKIHLIYENPDQNETKSFYNSLYFEIVKEHINYIFSNGKWYEIDNNFYQLISKKIDELDTQDVLNYMDYNTSVHTDENHYNEILATKDNTLELDSNLYKPTKEIRDLANISHQSSVELADIFNYDSNSETIQFIHVKKLSGASQTIHSFTQAKSSAQIFAYDKKNVEEFINKERAKKNFSQIPFSDIKNVEVIVSFIIPASKTFNKNNTRKLFSILERISLYETINIIYPLGFQFKLNFIDSNL